MLRACNCNNGGSPSVTPTWERKGGKKGGKGGKGKKGGKGRKGEKEDQFHVNVSTGTNCITVSVVKNVTVDGGFL